MGSRRDRRERRDLQQVPPTFHEYGQERAGGDGRTDEVDLDDPAPGEGIGVHERTAVGHTGVGDDDVHLPEPFLHLARDPGHRLVVGDVGVPVVALAEQPLRDLLERVRLQTDERDLGAPRGQLAGEKFTDAPRGPRDDRDLSLQAHPAHAPSLICA